jgi:hypothetical protein
MNADQAITEARARIIWGEPSSSVLAFLMSNGVARDVAKVRVKEFVLERNKELRRMGMRDTLIGILLTVTSSITLYLAFRSVTGFTSGINRAFGFVVVALLFGAWKLVRGIVYLVRPQTEHKSIPDIVESDILD